MPLDAVMGRRRHYDSGGEVDGWVLAVGVLLLTLVALFFAALAPWMLLVVLTPLAAWGIYIGYSSFKYAKWKRLNNQHKARETANSNLHEQLELLGVEAEPREFRPQRTGNGTRAGLCSDDPQGIKRKAEEVRSWRPQIKIGPRGGAYTEDVTKDGRPYRRYF